MNVLQRLLMPYKFKRITRDFGTDAALQILDIGCGNHSPTRTKHFFPNCRYFGVDRNTYNNDASDFAAMEKFYPVDLQSDLGGLDALPDGGFDVIIFSHVIEHLPNGLDVVERVSSKLRQGGRFYIEFPCERSLSLPSMYGTLNFCDDPTHVRVYTVSEIANILLSRGYRIASAGTRRDRFRVLLTPFNFLFHLFRDRRPAASTLWDALGFACYVYAERR